MNDDLIKRSDAIKAFCTDCRNQDKPCEHEATCKTMRILRNKKKLPSADRPQGEWIWKERHINRNYIVKGTDSMGEPAEVYVHEDRIEKRNYCSECGKLGDDIWLNYCPNCGAKMFAKDTNVSNKKGAGDE